MPSSQIDFFFLHVGEGMEPFFSVTSVIIHSSAWFMLIFSALHYSENATRDHQSNAVPNIPGLC